MHPTGVVSRLGYGRDLRFFETVMSLPLEMLPADKIVIVTHANRDEAIRRFGPVTPPQ